MRSGKGEGRSGAPDLGEERCPSSFEPGTVFDAPVESGIRLHRPSLRSWSLRSARLRGSGAGDSPICTHSLGGLDYLKSHGKITPLHQMGWQNLRCHGTGQLGSVNAEGPGDDYLEVGGDVMLLKSSGMAFLAEMSRKALTASVSESALRR